MKFYTVYGICNNYTGTKLKTKVYTTKSATRK